MYLHYVSDCGLTPGEIDFYTWYTLSLYSEQFKRKEYREWDRTRHIMLAAGNWAKGTKATDIVPLEGDKHTAAAPSKTDRERIKQKYAQLKR